MKRPPGDQFTFRAFISLSAKIQVPHDKIYVWATALNPHYQHGDWNAVVNGNLKQQPITESN